MSQVDTATLEKVAELQERFRYGWREARRRLPDGSYTWLRLPLTLYDVPTDADSSGDVVITSPPLVVRPISGDWGPRHGICLGCVLSSEQGLPLIVSGNPIPPWPN